MNACHICGKFIVLFLSMTCNHSKNVFNTFRISKLLVIADITTRTLINQNAFQKDVNHLLQWPSLLSCMHAPCHTCPLPCIPPTTHAPLPCMPPPCTPPTMHAPLPHMPPAMHAPHHAHPLPRTPPCGQTDTCENITFANFVCGR